MILPVCEQRYSLVSLLLLVDSILCSLLSDGFLFLYIQLCRFRPVSVIYVLLQCWHFKCSFDRKFLQALLTRYDGKLWVLGRVLFDLSYSLGSQSLSIRKNDTKLELVFAGLSWSILLDLSFDFNILRFLTSSAISHSYSHVLFWQMNWYICVIWFLQHTNLNSTFKVRFLLPPRQLFQ